MASSSYDLLRSLRMTLSAVEGSSPMTTKQYLDTPETNRPRELAHGILREPPAPFFSHQQLVLKIARLLADYVESAKLGIVGIAPLDVILDDARSLIVQPDVLFVANERLSIVRDQVWGGPDLVAEVLSAGTARHDRTDKLGWYRQYGVRECWLVDSWSETLTVADFTGATPETRAFRRPDILQSVVFPDFHPPASLLLP
jgi:Uma2 family endonuclease